MKLHEALTLSKNMSKDPLLNSIGAVAQGNTLVNMRTGLEKLFPSKEISFTLSPHAMFIIKHKGKTIVIINSKYTDEAELTVGKIAIGYLP